MALWNKLNKKTKIQDVVGVVLKKPITVQAAVNKYKKAAKKAGKTHWSAQKIGVITAAIDPGRQLNSLTVGDLKNANSSGKTIIQRLIKFAATGHVDTETKLPPRNELGSSPGSKSNRMFAFRAVPTADVLKLIPVEGLDGKYRMLKLQINEFVSAPANGQSWTIDQPKSAYPKTIGIILKEVNDMLEERRSPWKLYHNPLHEVFILTPKKGA